MRGVVGGDWWAFFRVGGAMINWTLIKDGFYWGCLLGLIFVLAQCTA
jgi:hypothetical protein